MSLPDGRRRKIVRALPGETKAATRKRAEAVLAEMTTELSAGLTVASTTTVADYAAHWLETERTAVERGRGTRRRSTVEHHANVLAFYVTPHVGSRPLSRLTHADVERMLDRLADRGLAKATMRHARISLSVLLRAAHRDGLVAKPLATEDAIVPKAQRAARSTQPLDAGAVNRLLGAVAGERWEPVVGLMGLCGLRKSEALGLGWNTVDLDAGTVGIERAMTLVAGELLLDETKTIRSRRILPLPPQLVVAMRRWRAEQAAERLAAGPSWGVGWAEHDLVFTDPIGRPLTPGALRSRLRRATTTSAGIGHTRPHALRHGTASVMIDNGASIAEVSEVLGHASPAVTLAVYSHAFDAGRARAVSSVAEAVGSW